MPILIFEISEKVQKSLIRERKVVFEELSFFKPSILHVIFCRTKVGPTGYKGLLKYNRKGFVQSKLKRWIKGRLNIGQVSFYGSSPN